MSSGTYTCQRCRQPLLLDSSLVNITKAQHDTLIGSLAPTSAGQSLTAQQKFSRIPAAPSSRQAYLSAVSSNPEPPPRNPAESFILLSESQIGGPSSASGSRNERRTQGLGEPVKETTNIEVEDHLTRVSLTDSLLNILSAKTNVDHPLCRDCSGLLQEILQGKLEELQRERDGYLAFEREWAGKSKGKGKGKAGEELGVWEELERERERLEEEEKGLLRELEEVEREGEELGREEREMDEQEEQTERQEIEFLQAHDELLAHKRALSSQLLTERTFHLLASQALSRLESTNVYNDVFQIGHVPLVTTPAGHSDGRVITPGTTQTVGTINGLRLGGRPWVEWAEINAACGLVALCVDRIAAKVGCTFETYKIVPYGSFSRVDELPPSKNSYELYASSDITPTRLLQNRRFNYALVGLLDCLRQLVEFGKATQRGWAGDRLEIHKDKIGDHSIRLSFGMGMSSIGIGGSSNGSKEEEAWTKALRAVLAVLKRILVVESEADREIGL